MFESRSLISIPVAAAALATVIGTWILAAPGTVPEWERTGFEAMNQLPDWLFPIVWGPMQFGAIVGALIVASILLAARHRAAATLFAAAATTGWLLAQAVKHIVARDRPLAAGLDPLIRGVDANGFGFISGHTTVAFASATVIWVFYGRRWGVVAYVIAAVVGFARIFVGAHLPLDVVGGAAAGTLIAGLVTWVESRRRFGPRARLSLDG